MNSYSAHIAKAFVKNQKSTKEKIIGPTLGIF